jgi:hypothetical protein
MPRNVHAKVYNADGVKQRVVERPAHHLGVCVHLAAKPRVMQSLAPEMFSTSRMISRAVHVRDQIRNPRQQVPHAGIVCTLLDENDAPGLA